MPGLALCPSFSYLRVDHCSIDCTSFPGEYGILTGKKLSIPVINGSVSGQGKMLRGLQSHILPLWERYDRKLSLHEQLVYWASQNSNIDFWTLHPGNSDELMMLISAFRNGYGTRADIKDIMLQNDLRDIHRQARAINCESCGCCFPCIKGNDNYRACPFDVDMPALIALFNDREIFGRNYSDLLGRLVGYQESKCRQCGACNKECPKHYKVSEIAITMLDSILSSKP